MNSLIIASNIVKRVFKSPKTIIGLLVIPVILIVTIVFALNSSNDTAPPKVGVVDLDQAFYSQKVLDYINQQEVNVIQLTEDNYQDEVKNESVSYAIVIPRDLTSDLSQGREVNIKLYSRNKDLENEKQAMNQFLSHLYSASISAKQISEETDTDVYEIVNDILTNMYNGQLQVQYQQTRESTSNQLMMDPTIGFSVMFMMVLIFTSIGIVLEDKKKLVLARMYVSPIKEYEIIVGNIIGSLVLGLIQLIPLIMALKISYEIESMRILFGLFVILLCFLIAIIGIGIGISGIIKKTYNPTTIIATVVTPSCILGGTLIPSSMLPDVINKIGYIVPQKWVMLSIKQILQGESLASIGLYLVIIIMFGFVFSTFGLKTLRPINE